jgi:tryptophanyl-tRNA synthetase
MSVKRVLTGMRTTGLLHLGHYVGALKQWVEVQNSGEYDCYFLLADVQALTTHSDHPEILTKSIRDVVLDWLAVGLDPSLPNVHFVQQSQVMGRSDLSVLFSMLATEGEVKRNPTVKSEIADLKDKNKEASISLGFLNYPVDQAADIYMISPVPYEHGDHILVPVGEDQVPHLEYASDLAKRFNNRYGKLFTPCEPLVGDLGRLVGTDGQAKMGKSLGNTINLSDDAETVRRLVKKMFTDPTRIRSDMPGETVNNPVFIYHRAFNPNVDEVAELTERYQHGKVGDVEVKERLAAVLNDFLDPIRERRAQFEHEGNLREIVMAGTEAAQKACDIVMHEVREKMHIVYPQ